MLIRFTPLSNGDGKKRYGFARLTFLERPGRKHNHVLKFQKVHLHTAVKVIISVVRGLKVGLFLPSLFLGPAQLFSHHFFPGIEEKQLKRR